MDSGARSEFVKNYKQLVAKAWADASFADRLRKRPKAVLDEVGLQTPGDATVEVIAAPADGDGRADLLERQVRMWDEGDSTGAYRLVLPDAPQVEAAELSEAELSKVAGGGEVTDVLVSVPQFF
jgi:hypothetical protein